MLALAVVLVICFYGLISLGVFFIFYTLRKIKKVGFLKTVKSKTTWTIIVLLCIGSGLLYLFFVSEPIQRSGNQLFKDYVLDPMPKSIKVIDSYDGSSEFYPQTCLHFKISPDDFQLILASRKWEIDSGDTPARLICNDSLKNSWDFPFPPPSLGSNVIIYTFIPNERDDEIMFTNAQMNEVYYKYYDGYMP